MLSHLHNLQNKEALFKVQSEQPLTDEGKCFDGKYVGPVSHVTMKKSLSHKNTKKSLSKKKDQNMHLFYEDTKFGIWWVG